MYFNRSVLLDAVSVAGGIDRRRACRCQHQMDLDKIQNAVDLAKHNHKLWRQELILAFPAVASIERCLVRIVMATVRYGLRQVTMALRRCDSKYL